MSTERVVALLGFNSFPDDWIRLQRQLVNEGCTFTDAIEDATQVIVVAPGFVVSELTQQLIHQAEAWGLEIGWSHGEPMIEHTDAEEERIANYLDE